MKSPKTLLVVVNPDSDPSPVIEKACRLARACNARMELFVCDSTRGYWLDHDWDQTGVDSARCAYIAETKDRLRSLIESTACREQLVSVDASCETPFHIGVRHKIERCGADLVVKAIGDSESSSATDADIQLMRTCPKPLLLTQQLAWPKAPSIAAAIDVSARETPGLARQLVETTAWLAGLINGQIDLIHVPQNSDKVAALTSLQELAADFAVPRARAHIVSGDPMDALPRFMAQHPYDIVVLGALGHAHGLTNIVGSLPYDLLNKQTGDLLLLKPEGFASQASFTNSRRAAAHDNAMQ